MRQLRNQANSLPEASGVNELPPDALNNAGMSGQTTCQAIAAIVENVFCQYMQQGLKRGGLKLLDTKQLAASIVVHYHLLAGFR